MNKSYSIIIPLYNTDKFLFRNCIDSVINNKGYDKSKVEFVIVDDGSSIDYSDLIESLKTSGHNINYHRFEVNKGQYAARLKGFELAKNDYVLGLDSDDMYTNDALSVIDSELTKHPCDVTYWLTKDDYDSYISYPDDLRYVYVPNEGIVDNEVAWNLMANCNKRYIQGYLVTKCVSTKLMKSVAYRLKGLDLGRITLLDDQVISYEIFNQLRGNMNIIHKGLYLYGTHNTDTRLHKPDSNELRKLFISTKTLRDQFDKYIDSLIRPITTEYRRKRNQILATISKIHSYDITEDFWNLLMNEFGRDILETYSNNNKYIFKKWLDE